MLRQGAFMTSRKQRQTPLMRALRRCLPVSLMYFTLMGTLGCASEAPALGSVDSDALLDGLEGSASTAWVGTNPTGQRDIEGFELLSDGATLEIEMGFQGAWMVVLALRATPQLSGMTTLRSSLFVDEDLVAYFEVKRQFLVPADDGFEYYLNLFLIVPSAEYVGMPGRVVVEAFEHLKEETTIRAESRVELVGGIVPDELPPPPDF